MSDKHPGHQVMCHHGHCCTGNPSDLRQTSNELASQRRCNTLSGSDSNATVCLRLLEMNCWLVCEAGELWWGWQISAWHGIISVRRWKRMQCSSKNKQKAIRFKIESQEHCQKCLCLSSISNSVLFFSILGNSQWKLILWWHHFTFPTTSIQLISTFFFIIISFILWSCFKLFHEAS